MDCVPLDDVCKIHSSFVEEISSDAVENPTVIGIFNGRKYSFMMVDGSPVIAIEKENPSPVDKTEFLMED